MPRRTRRSTGPRAVAWLLNTLLLALALTAVLIGVRLPLAEEIARTAARAQGLGSLDLRVTELHPQRIVVRDIALPKPSWRARRIGLTLRPGAGMARLLRRINVDGLDVTVDLRRERPFAGIGAVSGGPPEARADATGLDLRLPSVRVNGAVVRVRGPARDATLRADARIERRRDGNVHAALRGAAETPAGTLEISLAAADLADTPALDAEIDGPLDVAALPWPTAWPVRATAGTANLRLTVDAELPPLGEISGPADLTRGRATASLAVDARGLALPPFAGSARLTTTMRADLRRTTAVVGLTEPLHLAANEVNAKALTKLGLPRAAADLAARTKSLTLAPWSPGGELVELVRDGNAWRIDGRGTLRADLRDGGSARVRAALRGRPGLAGTATPELTAEPLQIRLRDLAVAGHRLAGARLDGRASSGADGLVLPGKFQAEIAKVQVAGRHYTSISTQAPIRLTYNDDRVELRTTDSGRITHSDPLDLGGVQLSRLDLRLARLRLRAGTAGVRGTAILDPGTLTLIQNGGLADGAEIAPGPVRLRVRPGDGTRLRARLNDASARLPALKLRASGIAADLQMGGTDEPMGTLEIGRLYDGESPARFAPLALRAVLRRAADQLIAAGTLRVRDRGVSAPFAGRHDLADGSGMLRLSETRLTFAPGKLQPAALSPVLERLSRVEGEVAVETALRWRKESVVTPASMRLSGVSFDTPAARVEGLSGTIRMASLSPPVSEPAQTVTAERVVAGVPLNDVRARFQVIQADDGSGTALAMDRVRGALAGGEVFVRDSTYRPGAPENAVTVRVAGLSLKDLFEQLDLKGVSGEGKLSGAIPVRVGDAGVTVADGQLAAETNGVLRIDLARTGDALKQQSRPVRLMVRALQDFRYDALGLTVNRSPAQGLSLKVSMKGRNPDVLDGYPFAFNVTLTGDLEPVLMALRDGRQLTTDLLQRALEADRTSP